MYIQSRITHDNTNRAVLQRFTIEPVYDDRGIARTEMRRMYLRGQILGDSQSTIKSRLDTVRNAYALNNFDVALYHDDGTRSFYYLTTADSLGGTKVKVHDYPELGNPCEYANGVFYNLIIEAEYALNEASPMIFREEIEHVGYPGPLYGWHEAINGPPERYIIRKQQLQMIVQSGYALGLTGLPLKPDPLLPNLEDTKYRVDRVIGPKAAGANLRFINWGRRWSYTFFCPTPQFILPNTR